MLLCSFLLQSQPTIQQSPPPPHHRSPSHSHNLSLSAVSSLVGWSAVWQGRACVCATVWLQAALFSTRWSAALPAQLNMDSEASVSGKCRSGTSGRPNWASASQMTSDVNHSRSDDATSSAHEGCQAIATKPLSGPWSRATKGKPAERTKQGTKPQAEPKRFGGRGAGHQSPP